MIYQLDDKCINIFVQSSDENLIELLKKRLEGLRVIHLNSRAVNLEEEVIREHFI